MDGARLDEAVKLAIASENPATKEMTLFLATTFEPMSRLITPIGPLKDRGGASGVITRHGYIVAEWAIRSGGHDLQRYEDLSHDRPLASPEARLIPDLTDYTRDYMPPRVIV